MNDRRTIRRWLLPAAWSALAVLIVVMSCMQVTDDDVYWHLATGRYIAQHHTVPDRDVFGFVTQGTPWIPFEWGWDLLTYGLFSIGNGYVPLQVLLLALTLATLSLELGLMRRLGLPPAVRIAAAALLLLVGLPGMQVRPHLVTRLGLVAILWIYADARTTRRLGANGILLLPAIVLVWVNMHPGVLAGVALIGLLALYELAEAWLARRDERWGVPGFAPSTPSSVRRLFVALALSAVALLVNPHGASTLAYVVNHTSMKLLPVIREWLPPFSAEGMTRGFYLYGLLGALSAGAVVLALVRRNLFPLFVVVPFLAASLMAIRFIPDFAVVATAFTAAAWYPLASGWKFVREKRIAEPAVLLLLVLVLTGASYGIVDGRMLAWAEYHLHFGYGPDRHLFSTPLIAYMREKGIVGRPFNQFEIGGQLLWELEGEQDFIDSRNLNDSIWDDYYAISGRAPGFEEKLDRYGVDHVVVFIADLVHRPTLMETTLIPYCSSRPDRWRLVYWDDRSQLYLRNGPRFAAAVNADTYAILNPYYFAYEHALFDSLATAYPGVFREELARKLREDPDGFLTRGFAAYARQKGMQ